MIEYYNISIEVGESIVLCEESMEDVDEIFSAIYTHADVLREWLPWVDAMKTPADEEAFIKATLEVPLDKRNPFFLIRREGQFCGLIGLLNTDRNNHRTEIGYWLLPEYQHQGIMTRSVVALCRWLVKEWSMKRIAIRCAVGNAPSNAVPLRLGFVKEGVERAGELLVGGVYADINVYSILKEEVLKLK